MSSGTYSVTFLGVRNPPLQRQCLLHPPHLTRSGRLARREESSAFGDPGRLWPRIEADRDVHCSFLFVDRLADAGIPVADFLVSLLHKPPRITGVVHISRSQSPVILKSGGCLGIQPM